MVYRYTLILWATFLMCPGYTIGQTDLEVPADIVFKNARVIEGTGSIYTQAVVVIRDGHILSISEDPYMEADGSLWRSDWQAGSYGLNMPWEVAQSYEQDMELDDLEASGDSSKRPHMVIDLAGMTLMPGIIDTHVHLVDSISDTVNGSAYDPSMSNVARKLNAYLDHGVTTIKSMGDPLDEIIRIRDSVRSGKLNGPRILTVGPMLTISGTGESTAAAIYRQRSQPKVGTSEAIASPDDAIQTVRHLAWKGVDAIHVDLCESSSSMPMLVESVYSREILSAIVDQAHREGLTISAYTVEEPIALMAISLGFDGLEHGVTRSWLSDTRLERSLGMQNVGYAPALGVYARLMPESMQAARENLDNLAKENAVRIVLGSDTFGLAEPGLNTIQELRMMVQAGMTPARAVQAATYDAAQHVGISDETGSIQVGKRADLIILEQDPFEDISALFDITMVVKYGVIVTDNRESGTRPNMR
ncbi:MAG: amidohydrolase family protein [Candidatus Latescibacteria bacterium]|jgi:imidazolonepropionase-like amidohydrolase|nr:amidohydrolase family protein [Candidatus Latescibacterota bacterium]